jgi:hypothetical protein
LLRRNACPGQFKQTVNDCAETRTSRARCRCRGRSPSASS